MNKHLPEPNIDLIEHCVDSQKVFDGHFLHVKRDHVRLPDHQITTREYIEHSGAVMIIPQFDDGSVLLEAQYRYPMKQVMLEYPAGKLDAKESSLECAQRELEEETGFKARQYYFMTRIHPVISYSTEFIDIYLARGLIAGVAKLDQGEFLEAFRVSLEDILSWIHQGKVSDTKTIIGTMWLEKWMAGSWKLPKPVIEFE